MNKPQVDSAKAAITVSVGPGPYVQDLVEALSSAGMLECVIYSWPDLRVMVRGGDPPHLKPHYQADWFRHFVRLAWGTWRRIPGVGKSERPRVWVDAVYDIVAARHIGHPGIFLGWSQVSLHSMEVARQQGATVVLEHPMLHVDEWQRLIPEECKRWGVDPLSCYSIVPDAMAERMRREYECADQIVVPSQAAVESFVKAGVAREKLHCLPFGVDTKIFHPIKGREPEDGRPFRVLYAGRMELLKGLQYLIEAWKTAKLPNAELVLVGRELPEIQGILAKAKEPNIRVISNVPRNQLTALYHAADVLVFPSLCDGFGLVMLEAMACGVPVIATSNCGGPDCITEGENGFIVPIRDAGTIAAKLSLLNADRARTRAMGEAGRQRVEREFSREHYAQRLAHYYQGLADERSKAQHSIEHLRAAFIHGRPAAHPFHAALAESIGAQPMFVDPILRWHDRESSAFRRYLSWLLCAVFFPQRDGFDLFLTEGGHATPYLMRKLGLLRKNQRTAALMANETLYFMKIGRYPKKTREKLVRMLSGFDGLICIGEMQARLARELIAPHAPGLKILTTSSSVAPARIETLSKVEPSLAGLNIVFIANGPGSFRAWYKGIDLTFAAMEKALTGIPQLSLTVVGGWDEAEKQKLSQQFPKAFARTEWLGVVSDIGPALEKSALTILMGRGDAYPVALLEAMLAGVPAVVSEWTGSSDAVKSFAPNMVVPLDEDAAAEQIVRYFQLSFEQRKELSRQSRAAVAQCTEENAFRRFREAVDEIMRGASEGGGA